MPRGRAGTQMSHLPVQHAPGETKCQTLCGRGCRKWGPLIAAEPEWVDCKFCLAKMREMSLEEIYGLWNRSVPGPYAPPAEPEHELTDEEAMEKLRSWFTEPNDAAKNVRVRRSGRRR